MKYTTKKTNTLSSVSGLIFTAVLIYFAFHFHSLADAAANRWQSSNEDTLRSVSTILFIFAAVELYSTICGLACYANVFDNRISGYGLIYYGYAVTQFDLDFEQITDITMSLNKLKIKTASQSFDVITTPERGKEIVSYFYNSKKAR